MDSPPPDLYKSFIRTCMPVCSGFQIESCPEAEGIRSVATTEEWMLWATP